jgi:hypothetical protein
MIELKKAPFFSVRNVPFWALVAVAASFVAMMVWL